MSELQTGFQYRIYRQAAMRSVLGVSLVLVGIGAAIMLLVMLAAKSGSGILPLVVALASYFLSLVLWTRLWAVFACRFGIRNGALVFVLCYSSILVGFVGSAVAGESPALVGGFSEFWRRLADSLQGVIIPAPNRTFGCCRPSREMSEIAHWPQLWIRLRESRYSG